MIVGEEVCVMSNMSTVKSGGPGVIEVVASRGGSHNGVSTIDCFIMPPLHSIVRHGEPQIRICEPDTLIRVADSIACVIVDNTGRITEEEFSILYCLERDDKVFHNICTEMRETAPNIAVATTSSISVKPHC